MIKIIGWTVSSLAFDKIYKQLKCLEPWKSSDHSKFFKIDILDYSKGKLIQLGVTKPEDFEKLKGLSSQEIMVRENPKDK